MTLGVLGTSWASLPHLKHLAQLPCEEPHRSKDLTNAPGICYQVYSADIFGVLFLSEENQERPGGNPRNIF